jgi:hypothetical protein
MKSNLWLRGRKLAEQAIRGVKGGHAKEVFIPIFFNADDYVRVHGLLHLTDYETWDDYREKIAGARSLLTDTDGVSFVDIAKCIDAGGLAEATTHLPGGFRLTLPVLAPFFALKFQNHVIKPSQVSL